MRKQIERYILGLGWKADEDGGFVDPSGDRRVSFETDPNNQVYGWDLARFDDSDNADGIATARWVNIDEGESLGELKLALAGLEAQATQGAL